MKKLIFTVISILTIMCLFIACDNAAGEGYIPNTLGNTRVTLQIVDHHTSRTILPDDWDDTKKSELTYHLIATNLMYTDEVIEKDYAWADFTNGQISLDLAASRWSFELTASKDSKEILSAIAIADLRNGPQTIPFDLKPFGTENGTVNIKLTYTKPASDPDIVEKVTVGLYNNSSDFEDKAVLVDDPATINSQDTNTPNVVFEKDVPPGKYYYIARFYNDKNVLLMPYIEEVYVDPGNTSTKEITIPDVINMSPAKPTELQVKYLSNTIGTATVEFSWIDNAINETGFVLEITEYSDPTTPIGVPVVYDENSDLDNIARYVSGNLIASATTEKPTFTIKIKTGTLYKAKIKAVNKFGESEYCEYENDDSENFINLAVISMYLNGGTVKTPELANEITQDVYYGLAKNPTPEYDQEGIYSYTYSISKTYPLPESIDNDNTNYIKRDGFTFAGWYHMIETGDNAGQLDYPITEGAQDTAITEYATKTYQNDSVYALWESKATIEVTFPEYDDVEVLVTPDGQVFYSDVDVGTSIEFTGPDGYCSYVWIVDGKQMSTDKSWTYVTEGTETEAQNHMIMLTVEEESGQTYSNTVFIRVKNTVTEP